MLKRRWMVSLLQTRPNCFITNGFMSSLASKDYCQPAKQGLAMYIEKYMQLQVWNLLEENQFQRVLKQALMIL